MQNKENQLLILLQTNFYMVFLIVRIIMHKKHELINKDDKRVSISM